MNTVKRNNRRCVSLTTLPGIILPFRVNPEDGQGLKEAESYDPATNMWTKNADMHSARYL